MAGWKRDRPPLLAGLLAMAGVSLCAPLLAQTGLSTTLFYLLLVVLLIPLAAIGLGAASRGALGPVLGLLVMVLPPVVAATSIDVRLAGRVIDGPPDLVPTGWASGYRFDDAIVRTDLVRTVSIVHRGKRGDTREGFIVAPVVSRAWATPQPVRVWAVAGGTTQQAAWSQPYSAGLPLLPRGDLNAVIRRAADRAGLVTTAQIIAIRWVRDPADEIVSARLHVAAIVGIAGLLWVIIIAIFRDRSRASGA